MAEHPMDRSAFLRAETAPLSRRQAVRTYAPPTLAVLIAATRPGNFGGSGQSDGPPKKPGGPPPGNNPPKGGPKH
jgi:hypothetical protein